MCPLDDKVFPLCLLLLLILGACAPGGAEEAYLQGEAAFSAQNYEQAITHYSEAITLDARSAAAYLGRGRAYWITHRHASAVEDLNRAIDLQPNLIWAYFFRGSSLIALRQYEEGLADLEKVTSSETMDTLDLVRAFQWRGIALLNLERYEEALAMYTRCVELQPDYAFYYLERGRVYEAVQKVEEAMADYRAYLDLRTAEDDLTEDALTQEARARLEKLSEGDL